MEKAEGASPVGDATGASSGAKSSWAYPTPLIEQGSVLLSHPGCRFGFRQQYFHKAIILLISHCPGFDLGLILNRPTAVTTADISVPGLSWPLGFGGDCQGLKDDPDSVAIFCLHMKKALAPISKEVVAGIFWMDLVLATAAVKDGYAEAGDFLVVAGYCGWGEGQLQQELDAGHSWTMAAVDRCLLIDELQRTQEQLALRVDSEDAELADGTDAWQRLYAALGMEFREQAESWRPDVALGDMRLRGWIDENLRGTRDASAL